MCQNKTYLPFGLVCFLHPELINPRLCLCCYTRPTSVIQPRTGICTIAGLRHCWRSFSDRFDSCLLFRSVRQVYVLERMCEMKQEKSHLALCILILSRFRFLFSSDCPFIHSHASLRQGYHRLQKREHVEKCVI